MGKNIPAFISSAMIWDKLNEVNKKLDMVLSNKIDLDMRELTMNKIKKMLKVGESKILAEIESGRLKARIFSDSKGRSRYRFSFKHVQEYRQMLEKEAEETAQFIGIEKSVLPTPEDIWKQVSGSNNLKRKTAIN